MYPVRRERAVISTVAPATRHDGTLLGTRPHEELDRFDAQRICEHQHAVQAQAVPTVLDPVDGLAIETTDLRQALLRPSGPCAELGHPVPEQRTVVREARMDR